MLLATCSDAFQLKFVCIGVVQIFDRSGSYYYLALI